MIKLTTNFTLEEFTITQHRAYRNELPDSLYTNAVRTCEMLERIRLALGIHIKKHVPIHINSGYRSSELNAAIGGQRNSDHITARAADWIAPKFGNPHEICKFLAPKVYELGIGQLIKEYATEEGGGWIHVSTKVPANPNNRIITIDWKGARMGV